MPIKNFDELTAGVRGGTRKTVALVQADDEHALQAVIAAKDIVDSVLVGDSKRISSLLISLNEKPEEYWIHEVPEGMHPSVAAARLIHDGKADFLMKGKIMTGDLLKGVLSDEAGLKSGKLMSHIILAQVPGYHKLLCITDGGMCTYPTLEQKVHITENAVNFFHRLGYERPNVAVLCAIEAVNPKMPETVHADQLKQMSLNGELPACFVEGPISYDLAMVPQLAKVKGYESRCSGDFDILIVPEIVVGNVLGKCLVYTCGGSMAGLVLGCKAPIVLTSRGSSAQEKYYSLALGAGVC